MAIVDEDLERLRATVSISDVVQGYVALRRVGRNWVGLCPFHAERSGSFNVREETGRYRCFGCGAAGDVFKFVQEIEHVDFVTAVEQLATKAGIQLTYTSGGENKDRQRRRPSSGTTSGCSRLPMPARLAIIYGAVASPATSPATSSSGGRPMTGTQ
jgi:DNA primase